MSLGSGRCHVHPQRPGLGICVECRRVVCAECSTQFEGINRCASCLSARLARVTALAARRDWSASGVALAAVSLAGLFLGFYGIASAL